MYVSAVSPTGEVATINLSDVRVVPSCPIALLSNHARQANVFYKSDRHTQQLDFNGINVPVRYTDNLLVEADVIIHSESPAQLPNPSGSPMVDAFNSHVTTPDTQERHITVCDYFGGVGGMTSCMPDHFSTQAYCDSNSLPREVFSYNNPSVPVNTSLYNAMSSPGF